MYYLNTDAQILLFQEMLDNQIYVDKSLLIHKVLQMAYTVNKYICITRPRRFGKTVNANMLGAYLTKGYDSHGLFSRLAVSGTEDYEKHINQYNVIHIDFSSCSDFCETYVDYMKGIQKRLEKDLTEAYPKLRGIEYDSISQLFQISGERFVFILDEWDAVFSEKFMATKEKIHFLKFLKTLLKDKSYVKFAYMTGVLPVAKYSSGSELNMFDEYNFMNDNIFDSYFGFCEKEVKELCEKCKTVSYPEMKQWYDGYYTSDGRHLFNPRSVSRALLRGVCLNYWTETGPMNEIADCIEHNIDAVREDIVKMISGIPVEIKLSGYSVIEHQLENRDEIFSAMVVYGFLSYHDGYIQIPNHELMEKFQNVLTRNSMGEVKTIVEESKEMLAATLSMDEKKVASILESVHDREIPFLEYNDENSLSCVITLSYLYARKDYWVEREAKSGKGFCDFLFYPKKPGIPAIVMELKAGRTAKNAIAQIKKKNYIEKVKKCDSILLVGIQYDKKTKRHKCIIEKV